MRSLIEQSYDAFNVFGREPEQLANALKAFSLTLSGFDDANITKAFKSWLADHSTMPTPADIRKLCVSNLEIQHAGDPKPDISDFPKPRWVQVVRDRNTDEVIAEYPAARHLSPDQLSARYPGKSIREAMRRDGEEASLANPSMKKGNRQMPWSFKSFKNITENEMSQLRIHMASFVDFERREEYRKYLVSKCSFPADWGIA